jgi:outer membrane cobalamin receptor
MKRIIAIYTFLFVLVQVPAVSGEQDHTRLMFVGEDLKILTIASGREESAWNAPAVADVITRDMIIDSGTDSLAELLEFVPGFYMPQNEWGTSTYLRGIRDSVLFLYDTVPMGSNISKGLTSIDNNISMASVKRVEIIRGAGSVLWGPDAFAGIVNIVPLTGRDFSGIETGVFMESLNKKSGTYINYGVQKDNWDAFGSLSYGKENGEDDPYGVVSFWGNEGKPVPIEKRYGKLDGDGTETIEFMGSASLHDSIKFSTRLSHYSDYGLMSDVDGEYPWQEKRVINSGFFRIEGNKRTGINSIIRMAGAVSWFNPEITIVDKVIQQDDIKLSGEIVYEQSFFSGMGILTAGIAMQNEQVNNAPVWDTYFPDYFEADNTDFLPDVQLYDYSNDVRSVFGQYLHKTGLLDLWAGIRDDSSDSGDNVSFNTGLFWHPDPSFILKLVYGSAYRTQFARQFHNDADLENEHIKTISILAGWKPLDKIELKTCVFKSFIDNHVVENNYVSSGVSLSNSQEIEGIEFEVTAFPIKKVRFHCTLTLLNISGPGNIFMHNDYSYLDENGEWVDHFVELMSPFDYGVDRIFNSGVRWEINDDTTFFADVRYHGPRDYLYLKDQKKVSYSDVWLTDVSLKLSDVFSTGIDLIFQIENIFNKKCAYPGIYGTVTSSGINSGIFLRKQW